MPTIGRNEPCPCGSGKKYKQCHGPIDAERATVQRKLKRASDTLLPKLMDALDRFGMELPGALHRFWNGAYTVQDIKELDQHEDRGSERFLTWFAFDAENDDGQTPTQRLIAEPGELELTETEADVLARWSNVRLQPFEVIEARPGHGLTVRVLFDGTEALDVDDHAAAKRVESGEVLIAHLVPAGDTHYIAGAAAQLTPDTVAQLREFAAVHLEDLRRSQPDATYADLIRARSHIFNHLMMALPREEHEVGNLDDLVARTRTALNVTTDQFGFDGSDDGADESATDSPDAEALDPAVSADSDVNVPAGIGDTTQVFESGSVPSQTGNELHTTPKSPRYDGLDD